ncbi:MAG: DMT family transporter [Pseudomonadota bacterium]
MSPNLKGALLALAAFAVFATHDVIVKLLGGTYSPVQIVFFSVLFGIPMVMFMLIRDAREGHLRPVHPWWTLTRTTAAVITGFSAFYAFSTLPLAQVYAILFAAPLLITVLAIPILGEVVRIRRWIAVIVGLSGVIIVLQPGSTELELGHLAALTAAVCGSFASIIVRKIGRDERTAVMMLYPMIANFLLMGALLPFVYKPVPIEEFGMMASIALLGFIGALCLIGAYKAGEAVIVAPMQYSQILWASLFGALFFDERIDQMTAIGAGVIIASGLYIVLRESRGGASENRPVLRTRSRVETGTAPRVSQSLPSEDRGP